MTANKATGAKSLHPWPRTPGRKGAFLTDAGDRAEGTACPFLSPVPGATHAHSILPSRTPSPETGIPAKLGRECGLFEVEDKSQSHWGPYQFLLPLNRVKGFLLSKGEQFSPFGSKQRALLKCRTPGAPPGERLPGVRSQTRIWRELIPALQFPRLLTRAHVTYWFLRAIGLV